MSENTSENGIGNRIAVLYTIGRAIRICYTNKLTLVLSALVVSTPFISASLVRLVWTSGNSSDPVKIFIILTLVVVGLVMLTIYLASVPLFTSELLDGNKPRMSQVVSSIWRESIAWNTFVIFTLTTIAAMTGCFFFVFPGVVVSAWFMLSIPILILEGKRGLTAPFDSMRRSGSLIKPRLAAACVLIMVLYFVPALVLGYAIIETLTHIPSNSSTYILVETLTLAAVTILCLPVILVSFSLVYIDISAEDM